MLPPPVRTSKNVVTLSCVSKRNAADATFCMLLSAAGFRLGMHTCITSATADVVQRAREARSGALPCLIGLQGFPG